MKGIVEREVRYLLPPWRVDLAQAADAAAISEVHLLIGNLGMRIRQTRRDGIAYELTFKFRAADHSLENTLALAVEDGSELFDRCRAQGFPWIGKTRYIYASEGGMRWEVDFYDGPFDFLAIAELEYDKIDSPLPLEKPSWYSGANWGCGAMDVTDEWQLLSKMLSTEEAQIRDFNEDVRRRIYLIDGTSNVATIGAE